MKTAFVFPGQGGQFVGMGKELFENFAASRAVFDEIDEAMGEKVSDIIFNGPGDELQKPENVQVAIFATSAAILSKNENWIQPDFVMGHSLGEYAALWAGGYTGLGDLARLLRMRGRLMSDAAAASGQGAMAAIIGNVDIEEICKKAGNLCEMANDNGANQWVVSGNFNAVIKAMDIAKEQGAKLVKQLDVTVPAHCSIMQSAMPEFKNAVDSMNWKPGIVPFISNKTADIMNDIDEIKNSLVYQLTHGVKWRESVMRAVGLGVGEFIEIGPGNVLTGLCKRIAVDANCHKIDE